MRRLPPTSAPRNRALLVAFLLTALGAATGCAPGGRGGSSFLDGLDPGDEDPGDVGGGGQPGAFLVQYPIAAGYARVGEELDPLEPVASVEVEAYAITPELPEGLTIDPDTGTISGTPLVATPPTAYAVVANAAIGSAATEVVLHVAGPTRFAFATNAGDSTVSSFSASAEDGRLRHLTYHIQTSFQEQPEEIALHPHGLYAYTANLSTATLATQRLDTATGLLQDVDTDAIGHGPYAVATHPNGRFVYVVSNAVGTLRAFRVDPDTGELEQVGASIQTLGDPVDLVVAPNGRYLLVLDGVSGIVQGYLVDASSGLPQLASELELAPGAQPLGAVVDLRSSNAYVTLGALETLVRIAVNPRTVALTQAAAHATGIDPDEPALDPRGRYLYVPYAEGPEETGPGVSVYAIDAASGALALAAEQELPAPLTTLRFAPDGRTAYDVDRAAMTVVRYLVNPTTGELEEGEAVRARQAPSALALLDGDEAVVAETTHLYVTSEAAGTLAAFVVDPEDGSLAPAGPDGAAGSAPISIAVDPFQRYVWTGDGGTGSESLIGHSIGEDGLTTPLFVLPLEGRPTGIAVEPTGRFVYVAVDGAQNRVESFALLPDGTLLDIDSDAVGPSPADVVADPTGQYLYVVNRGDRQPGNQGSATVFEIHQRTGLLTRRAPDALAGGGPTTFAFAPSAARLYSPFFDSDLVGTYDVLAATGTASIVLEATQTGNEPVDLALGREGRHAYVAVHDSGGEGGVELFDVREPDGVLFDADSGELHARASFAAGLQPVALALQPTGDVLYVLNRGSADVTTFTVVQANGALIALDLDATGASPSALAPSVRVQ